MTFVVALVLIVIAEVWTAIQVAHLIGWVATIALVLVISACGPWLVRRQGTGVWRRARSRLDHGEIPGREAMDGVLLLISGVLLTVPGFITGLVGLLLLLPPVRKVVRAAGGAWLARKVQRSSITVRSSVASGRVGVGDGRATTPQSPVIELPQRQNQ